MLDNNNLLEIIKTAAVDAINSEEYGDFCYGTVINDSPLKIQIEQKIILTKNQLALTRNVTDFKVKMTVKHNTEPTSGGSGYASFSSHTHEYKGKKGKKNLN